MRIPLGSLRSAARLERRSCATDDAARVGHGSSSAVVVHTRKARVTVSAGVAFVVATVALLAIVGCPPPKPPPPPPPPPPDGGTGIAGEECLGASFTHACALGLECNTELDAGDDDGGNVDVDGGGIEPKFGCVEPGDVDAGCHFVRDSDDVQPPDDGCKNGLVCGSSNSCAVAGVIGAACTSPADCDSSDCGKLADGSASVCVANECLTGCPTDTVCQLQGACGQRCVVAAGNGEACFTNGTDACSPVNTPCSDGLQCYNGDPNDVVTCAPPGSDGDPCNPDTPQQGCLSPDICDGLSRTCIPQNPP